MARCRYFTQIGSLSIENCGNCKSWKRRRCENEELLKKHYEDSKEFDFYDRMMRENKSIRGPL